MRFVKASLAAFAALATVPSVAAVNVTVEGGGTPIVFAGDNGNRLAVLGLDARPRDADNIVNLSDFTVDAAFISSLVAGNTGGSSRVANVFFCPAASATGTGTCSPLTTSISVADEARLFNSLIVEFNGTGNVVFNQPNGRGTTTLSLAVTRQGPAPIAAAVPEPSTWAMLLLGFFGIGAAIRWPTRRSRRLMTA